MQRGGKNVQVWPQFLSMRAFYLIVENVANPLLHVIISTILHSRAWDNEVRLCFCSSIVMQEYSFVCSAAVCASLLHNQYVINTVWQNNFTSGSTYCSTPELSTTFHGSSEHVAVQLIRTVLVTHGGEVLTLLALDVLGLSPHIRWLHDPFPVLSPARVKISGPPEKDQGGHSPSLIRDRGYHLHPNTHLKLTVWWC